MDFLGKVILKNLEEEEEDVADGQSDEEST